MLNINKYIPSLRGGITGSLQTGCSTRSYPLPTQRDYRYCPYCRSHEKKFPPHAEGLPYRVHVPVEWHNIPSLRGGITGFVRFSDIPSPRGGISGMKLAIRSVRCSYPPHAEGFPSDNRHTCEATKPPPTRRDYRLTAFC